MYVHLSLSPAPPLLPPWKPPAALPRAGSAAAEADDDARNEEEPNAHDEMLPAPTSTKGVGAAVALSTSFNKSSKSASDMTNKKRDR
jgi:hypothetical protein